MVEKYKIRTDLAMEQKERFESDHVEVSGVVLEEEYDEEKEIKITTVRIETENGAKAMGKPVGTYLTLEAPNMAAADEGYHREISETLADFLEKYMKDTEENQEKGYSVLVVGLGNREVTPDALGPYVVDQLNVTRHIVQEYGRYAVGKGGSRIVSAIVPGVMAQTGMESAEIIRGKYGIETYHHTGVYDLVNGKLDRSKAYQLAEPDVQKILKDNPSIEVVIDLHRDGVAEGTHLVTEVDGRQTAQIMFFNGLSRTRANGNISYLPNPYLEDNLAFSLQMEIAAAKYYPGFARHIFLRAYRYNMHFKPKTLLVEAGAQTNTVEEMRNAMELLAELLHQVLS